MNNILLGLFFLILGLLFANMLTNICGCRDLIEGQCDGYSKSSTNICVKNIEIENVLYKGSATDINNSASFSCQNITDDNCPEMCLVGGVNYDETFCQCCKYVENPDQASEQATEPAPPPRPRKFLPIHLPPPPPAGSSESALKSEQCIFSPGKKYILSAEGDNIIAQIL